MPGYDDDTYPLARAFGFLGGIAVAISTMLAQVLAIATLGASAITAAVLGFATLLAVQQRRRLLAVLLAVIVAAMGPRAFCSACTGSAMCCRRPRSRHPG